MSATPDGRTPERPARSGWSRPRRKRRRTLRRTIIAVLIGTVILSVIVLGALNFWQATLLLTVGVENDLIDQQTTRAAMIADGLQRLEAEVEVLAGYPEVISATDEFSAAFTDLGTRSRLLDATQEEELVAHYESVRDLIAEAGLEPPSLDDLLPSTRAGRYLQYHYIVRNPYPREDRSNLRVSESDASGYGEVHARWHDELTRYAADGAANLLLIDTRGRVIYSTGKNLDFATDLVDGPHAETALAAAVLDRLPSAPVGEAVVVDFERYLPAAGRPTLFVTAAVQSDSTTIGAVAAEIPIEALNAITTSNGNWDATGLGQTGETYVVGSDRLMRTDSRLWLEDPDAYVEALGVEEDSERTVELMRMFDSTVLIQEADTQAVEAALEGETFTGISPDYLGRNTLTVASPIATEEVDWVLLASLGLDEATDPLDTYARRMLLVLAVLVTSAGVLGVILASRMTRPIEPVTEAAARVAAGDLTTRFPDLGRNEFGDLTRRLNTLTADLRAQEADLEREERATTDLLLSALPERLVRQLHDQDGTVEDLVDTATVVSLGVHGIVDDPGLDPDSALELSVQLSKRVEEIAGDAGLERIRSTSTQLVFAAGLTRPGAETQSAATFVADTIQELARFGEEHGLGPTYTGGISSGEVVAGLLESDQLTYGVFGDPIRQALALESIASPGQVLIRDDTAAELGNEWTVVEAPGLVDLRGSPLEARLFIGRAE